MNMLPESNRRELKFSARNIKAEDSLYVSSDIFKWQVPNWNIFLVIRKKVTVLAGPWSANVVIGPRFMKTARKVPVNPNNFRKRKKILTIFYLFFLVLDIFAKIVGIFQVWKKTKVSNSAANSFTTAEISLSVNLLFKNKTHTRTSSRCVLFRCKS